MGNAKTLRTRIKSVNSTMHITKAMEIVASSKFKKAMNAMDKSRLYYEALEGVIRSLSQGREGNTFFEKRQCKKNCIIVIAGDRGLAGGYNNNIIKLARNFIKEHNVCVVPIGKKSLEFFSRRDVEIYSDEFVSSEKIDLNKLNELANRLANDYLAGEIDEIKVFHTRYLTILSQEAVITDILPVVAEETDERPTDFEYEPGLWAVLNTAIPQYLTALVNSVVSESFVCELSARRNAMNSANKNAEEMIEKLNLEYNRERQSAITQEITEIVAGS